MATTKFLKIAFFVTLFATCTSTWAQTAVRIHSGGAAYTDSLGQPWAADAGFSGGFTGWTTAPIANTNDPSLYQTERFGVFSYSFAVPVGNYAVTLKFVEPYWTLPGQRVFGVAINGTTVLSNFDILAQAGGANIALDESFTVNASAGNITIQLLQGSTDQPTVSAIQILPASFEPIRIHSGGTAYTDSLGRTWSADTGFSGGAAGWTTVPISKTNDPTLYQTERAGGFSYSFAAPPGYYAVTLKFAELHWTLPGQRVFGVAINGTTVLSNFDIVAQAGGANIALDESFTVNASTGNITIQSLWGAYDQPKISAIQILVATPPSISMQPSNQIVIAGQAATFSVAATGSAPLFQWQQNGTNIPGATTTSYTIPTTSSAQNNSVFTVVASNELGSVTSNPAALTVETPPSVLMQPITQAVVAGQPATFSAVATGSWPIFYQWQDNGNNIAGATASSYTIPATTSADNNSALAVVVTNMAGSVTSSVSTLTVDPATYVLGANPTSLNFGNANLGSNGTLGATITNVGNSSVTISNVSISGAGYSVSGVSTGQILRPGQAIAWDVTFIPAAAGSILGTVTTTSNATNSPLTIPLSGTGIQTVPHFASLTWAVTTSGVSGHNAYRSTVSRGPYTKLNSILIPMTSYADTTVQAGHTYFYVVTSVDSSGTESVFSTEVAVTIPAP